jgi:hypothetical protein
MNAHTFVAAAAALCAMGPLAAQPAPDAGLIERSGFIFRGTVKQIGASNVKALPASPSTIVVQVDEVLKAPQPLESIKGREVTVQEPAASKLKAGQQAVFYTAAYLYGENVAVKELAANTRAPESKTLQTSIADSQRQSAERALAGRIASASLVVSGRVVEVSALISSEESMRRSEHDPEYWRAVVEVGTVLKGQAPTSNRVTVLFAHSTDERWYFSPKYTQGQEGVFLLHPVAAGMPTGVDGTTLDRLDFQPMGQLDQVRALVQAGRR